MIRSFKYCFLILFLSILMLSSGEARAQGKKIDSIINLIKTGKEDTNKVNHLNNLAWRLKNNKTDTSIILGNQALALSEKLKWKRGIANSLGNLAVYYRFKADYPKALDAGLRTLKIYEELGIKSEIATCLGNIGNVYRNQGDFPKALDYYLQALKIDEELKDTSGMAKRLGNIGNVYLSQTDYPKALETYFKALKMDEEIGNNKGTAAHLGNIGIAYKYQGDFFVKQGDTAQANQKYSKALEYYFKSLAIDEQVNDKIGIAIRLGNIGNVYKQQADYPKALDYFQKALKINEELGNKNSIAIQLGNIGSLYTLTGKYNDAYTCLFRSLEIADSIGTKEYVKGIYEMISSLYEKSTIPLPDSTGGKLLNMEQTRLRALHYFKSYVTLRDTLFSAENKKQLVQKEMSFEFEKKEAATKAEQDKKDALAKEELNQKEKERNYFIAGFALVILLAGFIFRGYRQKQKANEIINNQKILVEEKQKEILDSIQYAKRIQESLLPSHKYIERTLKRLQKN